MPKCMLFGFITLIISAKGGCAGTGCFFLLGAAFLGDDMADIPKERMGYG